VRTSLSLNPVLLEPFLHVKVLCTCAEPGVLLNFFGLRLDHVPRSRRSEHSLRQWWAAWNESTPMKLAPGQWHMPFIGATKTWERYFSTSIHTTIELNVKFQLG